MTDLPCRELVELVTEYLENLLPLDERDRFELHLQSCAGCATYLEQIRVTKAVLGNLPEEAIDPAVKAKLLRTFRDWNRKGSV